MFERGNPYKNKDEAGHVSQIIVLAGAVIFLAVALTYLAMGVVHFVHENILGGEEAAEFKEAVKEREYKALYEQAKEKYPDMPKEPYIYTTEGSARRYTTEYLKEKLQEESREESQDELDRKDIKDKGNLPTENIPPPTQQDYASSGGTFIAPTRYSSSGGSSSGGGGPMTVAQAHLWLAGISTTSND